MKKLFYFLFHTCTIVEYNIRLECCFLAAISRWSRESVCGTSSIRGMYSRNDWSGQVKKLFYFLFHTCTIVEYNIRLECCFLAAISRWSRESVCGTSSIRGLYSKNELSGKVKN